MTIPYRFQIKGVRQIHRFKGRALLADSMGLGKTLQSLLYLVRHPEIRPAIVVCPASLKYNWEREAAHHFGIRAEVLEGTKPQKQSIMSTTPPVIIINYDILWPWMEYLKGLNPQAIIGDEIHYISSRGAKRTKAMQHLCRGVPHVVFLSGTPLTNRPVELYPILNILRPDLFSSFYSFAHRFCAPHKAPWGWEFKGATHLKELHRIMSNNLMIRRRKEDVLTELPDKTRSVVPMALSDPVQYERAHNDFLGWLADKSPERLYGAARAAALVKGGYLKRLAGQLKLPSVFQWVDDFFKGTDEKLVLFAVHRDIIKQLHDRYKDISTVVDGSITGRKRQKSVDRFQKSKGCRLFIGNKAAEVGINLTAASTLARCELEWTPGALIQSEDRIHRIGQVNAASIYYLIGRGTIEETLLKLLQKKQGVLNQTLDGAGKGDEFDLFDLLVQTLLERT